MSGLLRSNVDSIIELKSKPPLPEWCLFHLVHPARWCRALPLAAKRKHPSGAFFWLHSLHRTCDYGLFLRKIPVASSNLARINQIENPARSEVFNLVHPARFELATPGSEDQCSNPLSYGCIYVFVTELFTLFGRITFIRLFTKGKRRSSFLSIIL